METAPVAARSETGAADTQVAPRALAQREAAAPEPAAPEAAPAGVPSVTARRADSPQVAVAETMRDSAARQDTAVRRAEEAAAVFGERAARRAVTLDNVLVTDTLELDQARALVDGDVYAVSGLPIRSIMRGRFIGYEGIVVVEQPLDSTRVIRVQTRRPAALALDAVVVTGMPGADTLARDSVPANVQLRGVAPGAAPPAPAGRPFTRRVGGVEVSITGPLSADSLRTLLEKAAPIR